MSTKITTGKELAEAAINVAKNFKTLYVMGCFGAPMTAANKERYINNGSHDSYNAQASRRAMINAATADTFGMDCVCLIKALLWGWNGDKNHIYGGAKYASNGVPDIGADTMITKCSGVSTDFSIIEVGEVVWMTGHIGIYVGNGLAVECTPAWQNKVQITAVSNIGSKSGYNARKWTKHGKLPYITYESGGAVSTGSQAVSSGSTATTSTDVSIQKGTTVKVKQGAKTYTGGSLASFVYFNTYTVIQVNGDRVVIGQNGIVTAAVKMEDLIIQ